MNIEKFTNSKWIVPLVGLVLIFSILVSTGVLNIGIGTSPSGRTVITIGTNRIAYAAEPDFFCDGSDDDVEFQQALDALPSSGGQLLILAGDYSFSDTVSRAIDDVTIEGSGLGTYFANDGSTPIFSVGGQDGWVFSSFETDAGGITFTNGTTSLIKNCQLGTTYYAYKTSNDITADEIALPTGRCADYVVAASNASENILAQADYICDGTADDVQINAAITATGCASIKYTDTNPRPAVVALYGNFSTTSTITIPSYLTLNLESARITLEDNSNCPVITVSSGFYAAGGISYKPSIIGGVVDHGDTQSSGYCMLWQAYRGNVQFTEFRGGKEGGIRFTAGSSPSCFENVFEGVQIWNWSGSTSGISLSSTATDNLIHNCIIAKNSVASDKTNGIAIFISAGGNTITGCHFYWGYCSIYVVNKSAIGIFDNYFNGVTNSGGSPIQIYQTDGYECSHISITGNYFHTYQTSDMGSHINLSAEDEGKLTDVVISGNTFGSPNSSASYCIESSGVARPSRVVITSNAMGSGYITDGVYGEFVSSIIKDNTDYIYPGEVRSISGSLTGGAQNAILFAIQNPEVQDCLITKVVINITTGDADAANIDCGIADDASYTNGGTEFFDDLQGETVQVNDSWTTTEGQQSTWILWEDNASSTDSYITAKILDNDGTSIVGSFYIEYIGV